MKLLCAIFVALALQPEVPYKPSDEFTLELDYRFKQRQASDPSTFTSEANREEQDKAKYGGGPLPYLIVNITLLKLGEGEVRMRGMNREGEIFITRKAEVNKMFPIDLGFTVDMKDRVSSYEYNLYFLSAAKKETSRINLLVEEDGTFKVNGEVRGKF